MLPLKKNHRKFSWHNKMLEKLGMTMKGDSFSAIMKKHLPEDQFLNGNSTSQAGSYIHKFQNVPIIGSVCHIEVHMYSKDAG